MDNLTALKYPAMIALGGSILFLIAAFMPISKVYVETDAATRLQLIIDSRLQWNISQALFGLGALITAWGIGFVQYNLYSTPRLNLGWTSATAFALGAILWSIHVYLRMTAPEGWINGEFLYIGHLFVIYSILTQLGLVLLGLKILNSDFSPWVGWMFAVGGGLFFLLMIVFKDMPPFVYYVLTSIASIYVLRLD